MAHGAHVMTDAEASARIDVWKGGACLDRSDSEMGYTYSGQSHTVERASSRKIYILRSVLALPSKLKSYKSIDYSPVQDRT
jgi:hypothetical protein